MFSLKKILGFSSASTSIPQAEPNPPLPLPPPMLMPASSSSPQHPEKRIRPKKIELHSTKRQRPRVCTPDVSQEKLIHPIDVPFAFPDDVQTKMDYIQHRILPTFQEIIRDLAILENNKIHPDLGININKAFINAVANNLNTAVVAFGANSSGRSTLVNAWISMHLLPAGDGPVSARICAVRYAKQMSIFTAQLNKERNNVCIIAPIAQNVDEETLRKLAQEYLTRPTEPMTPEEYAQWVSTIIVVELPSAFLKSGVVIYDLPGFTIYDKKEVQDFLGEFLTTIQPVVAFVYANPTIAEAEMDALNFLKSALNKPLIKGDRQSLVGHL